jgi:hypothetical protein
VAGNVDLLQARAKNLAGGLEPELSVAVDVMFPDATFTHAVAAFQKEFPATLLKFVVESSAVIEPVLDGRWHRKQSKDVNSKLACDLAALSQFAESESGASL